VYLRSEKRGTMRIKICLLLIISVLFLGCSRDEEEPKSASVAANSSPIDPKSLADTNSETLIAFDEIGGQPPKPGVPIVVKTPSLFVRGWAVDQRSKSAAGGVIVNVDGKDFLAAYGSPRPDVAANLHSPDYVNSGFTVSLDSAAIGKGKHTMIFRVVTSDRKSYYQQKQTYDVVVE
jgi:hypothetical protein